MSEERIRPEVMRRLRREWLPLLEAFHEQQRPMRRLRIAVLLCPMVVLLLAIVVFIIDGLVRRSLDFDWVRATILVGLLGTACLCFVHLGKMQDCDNQVIKVRFALITEDTGLLIGAIGQLTCYGTPGGILDDFKQISGHPS